MDTVDAFCGEKNGAELPVKRARIKTAFMQKFSSSSFAVACSWQPGSGPRLVVLCLKICSFLSSDWESTTERFCFTVFRRWWTCEAFSLCWSQWTILDTWRLVTSSQNGCKWKRPLVPFVSSFYELKKSEGGAYLKWMCCSWPCHTLHFYFLEVSPAPDNEVLITHTHTHARTHTHTHTTNKQTHNTHTHNWVDMHCACNANHMHTPCFVPNHHFSISD